MIVILPANILFRGFTLADKSRLVSANWRTRILGVPWLNQEEKCRVSLSGLLMI